MSEPQDAKQLAAWSLAQAIWPPAVLAVLAMALDISTPGTLLHKLALIAAIAAATVTLMYSIILAFDALLFRIIARYEDELKGGAAVDDILARMHLKRPATTRPLVDRAAGTRRLVMRQRVALAVSAAATLLLAMPA